MAVNSVPSAPGSRLVAVRATGSEQVEFVHAVDAREMIATGGYVLHDVQPASPTAPKAGADIERRVFVRDTETDEVRVVHAIDAKEILAGPRYVLHQAGVEAPEPASVEPVEVALPPIEDLAAVLAGLADVDALMAMEARDERVEAKALYDARFNELAMQSARQ